MPVKAVKAEYLLFLSSINMQKNEQVKISLNDYCLHDVFNIYIIDNQ
jgi:hypothetical protein